MTHSCERHLPSTTCYQKCRCRCEECRAARSRYAKKWRLMTKRNITPYVDATPAREHVEMLMSCGMSHGTIALRAGMENSGLARLLGVRKDAPQAKRIRRETEQAILSVRVTHAVGVSFVDSTGTKRRLRDLALRGFGACELEALCGIEHHSLREIRAGRRKRVKKKTEQAVIVMHRNLEGKEPTMTAASNKHALMRESKRLGYAPLASWDDVNNRREQAKGVERWRRDQNRRRSGT